jgi:glycosyltransferase involved in cell wall biosynthesis
MKILQVTEFYAQAGGAELYMIDQMELLRNAGHTSTVIYFQEHPRTLPSANGPVYFVSETGQNRYERIRAIIREERPDIIYIHSVRDPDIVNVASQLGPTAAYVHEFRIVCPGLAKFYRLGQTICSRPYGMGCVPMIYLRRCATAKDPRSVYEIMQKTRRYLDAYQKVSLLLVASTYMKNLLVQNGLDAARIKVLPYFAHLSEKIEPVSLTQDTPSLLFAGRLEDEKGLPHLLRALAGISRQDFRLLVAGEGSRRAACEALAQELGIADRVAFLGWLSHAQLKEVYQQAACLIFPSIWPEPFGMVGIDAFGYGRPVIAFDVGGVSDWLQDGWNGYLVPSQDTARLAERIETLLAQPALARQLGVNGRETVEKQFRPKRHLKNLLEIFDEVLERAAITTGGEQAG